MPANWSIRAFRRPGEATAPAIRFPFGWNPGPSLSMLEEAGKRVSDQITRMLENSLGKVLAFLPNVLAALAILATGYEPTGIGTGRPPGDSVDLPEALRRKEASPCGCLTKTSEDEPSSRLTGR
jgi:hypothetical protein